MKKIKILRIIHTLDPSHGGPQNAIIDNSLSLIKKGCNIYILTNDNKNYYFKKKDSIKVINVGPPLIE
jgi:hypothetical protein